MPTASASAAWPWTSPPSSWASTARTTPPHIDTGDFVIVTNAEKIVMTGNKGDQKIKTRYSGYPGGLRAQTYNQIREKKPESLIEDAVKRMLPKGRLGRQMIDKLKVYKGDAHPHQAQQPTALPSWK